MRKCLSHAAALNPRRGKTDANVFVYTARNFFRGDIYDSFRNRTASSRDARNAVRLRRAGKEVAIECQRLGVEVIAVDCYSDAPAMHVAHRSYVINMLDGDALRALIEKEKPDFVVPEIEAIATETLIALEQTASASCLAPRRPNSP